MSASVSVARVQTRTEVNQDTWKSEPTLKEVLLLSVVCYAVYLLVLVLLTNYWHMFKTFGDNQAYVWIAEGIRSWNFKSIKEWQFFGLPYVMVAFSLLTHTSYWTAILSLCVICAFVATALSERLWGGWVAGVFAVCSRDWIERAVIGGAEPLFLALVFGSFLAARRDKWLLAASLAAFSQSCSDNRSRSGIFLSACSSTTCLSLSSRASQAFINAALESAPVCGSPAFAFRNNPTSPRSLSNSSLLRSALAGSSPSEASWFVAAE